MRVRPFIVEIRQLWVGAAALACIAGCGDDHNAVRVLPTATVAVPSSTPTAVIASPTTAATSMPTSTPSPSATATLQLPTATASPSLTATAESTPTATAESTATATATEVATFAYGVPLDPHSPWPKFRRDVVQAGHSPIRPHGSAAVPWTFHTGKGIFSSPVIDGAGNVYVGSADHSFYSIDPSGAERWRFETGEIIDSAALLDDKGRVYVGSGDGHLYALDRDTAAPLWTFAADDPAVNKAFINWFEGNVAIGADGTLYVPNDNFCTYAIDRDSAQATWCLRTPDQTWSLPALNLATGRLFMGNNFYFGQNVLAADIAGATSIWTDSVPGSVAASPLLTTTAAGDVAIVGAFDGFLHAYAQADGTELWNVPMRDHVYASPAENDGVIIQPCADGSIYAVRAADGAVLWTFDTVEPIRSSPAIDGDGNIYVGTGDGRLLVLNPDGTPRWSIRLIDAPRNDLNASPALGPDAVVIAGESGDIFSLPYDYCLLPAAASDARCTIGGGENLPSDGAQLMFTERFGGVLTDPPTAIDANEPLAFSLLVRENGDTRLALLDSSSLHVDVEPPHDAIVRVSGDRHFLTVVPDPTFAGVPGGTVAVHVTSDYLVNLDRAGLRFTGGTKGGSIDQTFHFDVQPRAASGEMPLPVPQAPGDPAGAWELYRLAAPLPTILPSYNQIGFDSIHYLIGLVEGDGQRAIGWGIGGRLAADGQSGEIDPSSAVRFPLDVSYDGGLLTMINNAGFVVEFNGFPIPFKFFRAAGRVDDRGNALVSPALDAETICGEITFYGPFLQLLGYCNPDTDILEAFGAAELRPFGTGVISAPAGVGQPSFSATATAVRVDLADSTLRASEHNVGILLVDPAANEAVPINYTASTTVGAAADGTVANVAVSIVSGQVTGELRAYLMVDTYPAANAVVHVP